MIRWLRLGLRLSLGAGRAGLLRTALMSSGAALGVLTVLACLSAVSAATAQQDRAQARTPQYAYPEEGVTAPTGLRMKEIDDAIGTRPLRRTAVTGVTAAGERASGSVPEEAPEQLRLLDALGRQP